MAWAVCEKCDAEVSWRAGRGARVSDLTHRGCGGQLRGKRKLPCSTCGRKRVTEGKDYYGGLCFACWDAQRKAPAVTP